jgi:peroxiredoxin
MLHQGEPIAGFSLDAHDGSTVSNTDLEGGAYLLYFYPKADTPG